MTDTIQVVRLDGLAVALWGEAIPKNVTQLSALIERVGDVIELTEQRMGNAMPPSSRWVSEWEANR